MANVLTSWKEIANHLGKGVRTVQRWENDAGLPVRRPQGGVKHVVFAIPEEIDEWLRLQQTRGAERDIRCSERIRLRRAATELEIAVSALQKYVEANQQPTPRLDVQEVRELTQLIKELRLLLNEEIRALRTVLEEPPVGTSEPGKGRCIPFPTQKGETRLPLNDVALD